MSVDDRLRRGLRAEADGLPPVAVERDLAAVQARARSRQRRRWAAGGAATIGAVAAVGVTVVLLPGVLGEGTGEPPEAAAGAPSDLVGEYVVDVPNTTEANRLQVNGRWVVRISSDGTMELTAPPGGADGAADASLRSETPGQVLTNALHSVPGCQAEPAVGTYAFTRTAGEVAFEVVGDDCRGRILLFTSAPWEELP